MLDIIELRSLELAKILLKRSQLICPSSNCKFLNDFESLEIGLEEQVVFHEQCQWTYSTFGIVFLNDANRIGLIYLYI